VGPAHIITGRDSTSSSSEIRQDKMIGMVPEDAPGCDLTMRDTIAVDKGDCFEHLGQYNMVEEWNWYFPPCEVSASSQSETGPKCEIQPTYEPSVFGGYVHQLCQVVLVELHRQLRIHKWIIQIPHRPAIENMRLSTMLVRSGSISGHRTVMALLTPCLTMARMAASSLRKTLRFASSDTKGSLLKTLTAKISPVLSSTALCTLVIFPTPISSCNVYSISAESQP